MKKIAFTEKIASFSTENIFAGTTLYLGKDKRIV